jgi:hypothetical protein
VSEIAPDFVRLHERAVRLAEVAGRFGERAEARHIRWIDLLAHQARLVESPLDIREALREQMAKSAKAWIFTSATLGDDDRLSWFTEPAGLDDGAVVRLGSPFDYPANARVFVPRAFPKPSDPGHADAVARLAARCASALGGRTFVLTTTLRSLQAVGAALRGVFDGAGEAIEVLVQGQGSKRQLMQRFSTRRTRCSSARRASGKASTFPVTRSSASSSTSCRSAAERSARRGSGQAPRKRRPQRLRRLLRRRGGGGAEAGRGAADQERIRPRPARRLRSAHGDDGLREAPVRRAAADEARRQRGGSDRLAA